MGKGKIYIISILLLGLWYAATAEGAEYQDAVDELTNVQKEAVYNIELNAPYTKDKSGVREEIDPETGDLSIICDLFERT